MYQLTDTSQLPRKLTLLLSSIRQGHEIQRLGHLLDTTKLVSRAAPEVGCLNHYVSLSLSKVVKPRLITKTVQQSAGEVQERRSHSVMQHLICRRLPEQLIRRLGANGSLVKLALPSRQMASWEDLEQMPTIEGQTWHSTLPSRPWRRKVTRANPTAQRVWTTDPIKKN